MPNVSVIIPVYNGARYLSQAVESVFKQTYRDFEIIIVDDGSTDNSKEIAGRFLSAYPEKITYLFQANRGPGAARNAGIREARGKYVTFLDADDWWLDTKLEKQASVLDACPHIGLVYCDFTLIDAENRPLTHVKRSAYELPRGSITVSLFYRYWMYTSTIMVRRECAQRAGFFREDLSVAEDFDYLLRLSSICVVERTEEKLLSKRVRENSLSSNELFNAQNDIAVLTDFLKHNSEFFKKNRREVSRAMGRRSFSLAYGYLRNGKRNHSLRYLLDSLRYEPSFKAVKCLLQVALPAGVVDFTRKLIRGFELQQFQR